ncbi:serine/threonine-protein kinase [Dokdonella sp.]|uniref:serine/threonine-protein kinase n=1 Tax=Dokdonella sp. TaxID=2291710 RepID=UPI002F41E35D
MTDDAVVALERRQRAFELLRAALDVEDGSRREWIAQQAGDDRGLADAVSALLATSGAGMLDQSAAEVAARLVGDAVVDDVTEGSRIGPWTIISPIGSGGMGTVYRVRRDGDGYVQVGALKHIKRGMDSDAMLARFRRERQILSRLAHPAIARLLDGGVAEDGRPFLVMEYIEGESLSAWSTRVDHGLDARVDLVLALCAAVAHAHHQLVVHRDIKPANVLVAAGGTPRLLDFGIARVLESDTDADATATAARFVSRAYAAPEQLQGLAATTATDIFQLGALLHELLTGLRLASGDATTRPSQRLVAARALAGALGPAAIPAKALAGDVSIVVARATDADPARRYATVEAFADDLRRWRERRPILARPDSTGYRLRRFIGRHRWFVGLAACAIAAVVAGGSVALWQARVAARQERVALERAATAERVKAFMIGLFQAPDPAQSRGAMPRADELLDRGAAQIEHALAGEPRAQAELYETMALSYMGLGRFDKGAELLERASAVVADAGDPALAARVETRLGSAQAELGRYGRALAALDRATRQRERAPIPQPDDEARMEAVRGWVLRDLGRYAESEAALRRSLERAGAAPGEMNAAALRALNNLAYTLQLAGRKQESIAAYERLVDWFVAHAPTDSQPRLWAEYTFAKSLRDLGEPARARDILERIRPAVLGVVGPSHADLAGLDIALAQSLMDLGDVTAPARVVDAVARSHAAVPEKNMLWANAEFALAEAEQHAGHADAATTHFESARTAYAALAGEAHPAVHECTRRLLQVAQSRD